MTTGYPAILMLDGRLGVVIGGGAVGERKVRTLLDAGARVKVITEQASRRLQTLADEDKIELHVRRYERGDLKGAAVVIASTDERDINQAIYEEAIDEGIPVNVVDDPPHCTFIAPSIVRRGDLMIAISTGGTNPAMAVRIREKLEKEFGPEYEQYFDLIKRLKSEVDLAPTQQARADAWYRVVDSDVLDLVRQGKVEEAYTRAVELLRAS
jgi:siroheme synthase-like protein